MRSRSSGCRTGTTGSACTSPTCRTTCRRAARSTRRRTTRGTSVYFTERAVHMFPSELATGLCSLNPHVDRLVQSCLMEVDRRGQRRALRDARRRDQQRRAHDLHRRQRDPDRRDDAADDARAYAPLVPLFELMHELFDDPERAAAGGAASIDFDLPEAEVVLSRGRRDRRHRRERAQRRAPPHRGVHAAGQRDGGRRISSSTACRRCTACTSRRTRRRSRSSRRSSRRSATASAGSGEALTPKHFQKLIDRMKGTPEERPIAALMLRTMQKARYDAVSLGHFGLAAEHYTHFTSPIRRYPDLVVHRMLRESRRGPMTGGAARGARRGAAGDRPAHLRDGAARRRCRARAAAVEEGPVHGRQGRRRVRGLRHRRRAVRPVRRADRALRRRSRARLEHGRRLLPLRRAAARAAAARTRRRSIGSATRWRCRSCAWTWSAGRSIWGWWRFSKRCARRGAAAAGAQPGQGRRFRSAQRPGRASARRRSARARC